jgi:hypothetical protein
VNKENMKKEILGQQKEVISENMMGIDFRVMLHECKPVVKLMRLTEDFGGYEMQFKKGEW